MKSITWVTWLPNKNSRNGWVILNPDGDVARLRHAPPLRASVAPGRWLSRIRLDQPEVDLILKKLGRKPWNPVIHRTYWRRSNEYGRNTVRWFVALLDGSNYDFSGIWWVFSNQKSIYQLGCLRIINAICCLGDIIRFFFGSVWKSCLIIKGGLHYRASRGPWANP